MNKVSGIEEKIIEIIARNKGLFDQDAFVEELLILFQSELTFARKEGEKFKGQNKRIAYQQGFREGERRMLKIIGEDENFQIKGLGKELSANVHGIRNTFRAELRSKLEGSKG